MGITIHYRGILDNLKRIPDLQRELADIAASMDWRCNLLDDNWSEPPNATLAHKHGSATIKGNLGLKGISLVLGGDGESLSFFFDAAGRLRSIMSMILSCEGQTDPDNDWVFVKTQFQSPDVHVWIVGLLKYLKKQYLSNLEVNDEGGFWETGDRAALESKMRFLDAKIAGLAASLTTKSLGDLSGLSAEEIALRIENFLKKRQ